MKGFRTTLLCGMNNGKGNVGMKCKVRLTHTVWMYVEADSEEDVQEWLLQTTPQEAIDITNNYIDQDFDEEIVCHVSEDSDVDYVIGG